MSFGRPPTFSTFQVLPPERGECRVAMREYLACLKAHKNNNGACRHLSKAYLACRMDHELMERENFDNLGFADIQEPVAAASPAPGGAPPKSAASTAPPPPPPSSTGGSGGARLL